MQECGVAPDLVERLREPLAGTADWMRNKGG
jgi:hypothetical protein